MDFSSLDMPDFIIRALNDKNITLCTGIQEKVIPLILQGNDVLGSSRTGSGKTFAYAVPASVMTDTESGDTQVLVVCPTRELAAQVTGEFRLLNSYREGCKTVPLFGGINMARQVAALKKNAEIVVGTPGRLADHLKRKTLKLGGLKLLVLDEADEMLKMGFKEELETIIGKCPVNRITAMFSATMPDGVAAIAENYMKTPVTIKIDDEKTRSVTQFYVRTGLKNKFEMLKKLILRLKPIHSIVFCNTKRMVDKLQNGLNAEGFAVSSIHGDMRQQDRKTALDQLKNGQSSLLIATDVAARGIDIDGVDIVFNYDVPQTPEYYVHRIGRTGRVDKKGLAFTLINTDWGMQCLENIIAATGNTVAEYETGEKTKKKPEQTKNSARNCRRGESLPKASDVHSKPEYIKKGELLKNFRDMIEKEDSAVKKRRRLNDKSRKQKDAKKRPGGFSANQGGVSKKTSAGKGNGKQFNKKNDYNKKRR